MNDEPGRYLIADEERRPGMEPEHPKESHRGGAPKGEVEETWYQVQPLTPQGTLLRTPPQELFAAIHSRDAKQKLASYTRINQDHNKSMLLLLFSVKLSTFCWS